MKPKQPTNLSFEEQMQRLEEIVEVLDDGEVGIEEMLTIYAEAMQHVQSCREYLATAEQKVIMIQNQQINN
ncbi:MAG: exodeoxyribonuclease VII small subunit [Pseudanabaenaceae cyanobacterium bins.39]|nr:exodeoxyribonuclease VII small subunit [Pseudanabaenaceae cyanobacterium bins.39]